MPEASRSICSHPNNDPLQPTICLMSYVSKIAVLFIVHFVLCHQVMNALDMEFEDDTFDLVWACESAEHMPDKKRYIDEMVRVLKPGGTLVLATWCQRDETPGTEFSDKDKQDL